MKVVPTKQIEEAYKKRIVDTVLKPLEGGLVSVLSKMPKDGVGWRDAISKTFNSYEYQKYIDNKVPDIVNTHIKDLSDWHYKKIYQQFKSLYNIDIRPVLNDYKTQEFLQPVVDTNIFLIKSIPAELLNQVDAQYNQILREKGFDQEAVMNMLSSRFNVSISRSKLIARDQTSKTVGALNQYRQTQAGVDRFMWRTSEDERVRPEHRELDGKVFEWSSPPSIGIPGHPINCRCFAVPILGHEALYKQPDKRIYQKMDRGNVFSTAQKKPLILPPSMNALVIK